MARCPLVRPETVRVSLSQDDWLELKKELTSGEYRQMFIQQMKDTVMGEKPILDMQAVETGRILAYVVGWSFVDFEGKPLDISKDTIDKLDHDTFKEVDAAVDAHHEAWEKAAIARKNAQSGEIKPVAISSSAA